jgi:hypothetical protein
MSECRFNKYTAPPIGNLDNANPDEVGGNQQPTIFRPRPLVFFEASNVRWHVVSLLRVHGAVRKSASGDSVSQRRLVRPAVLAVLTREAGKNLASINLARCGKLSRGCPSTRSWIKITATCSSVPSMDMEGQPRSRLFSGGFFSFFSFFC